MRLVYTKTGLPVTLGDAVVVDGKPHRVVYFRQPHKASSSGHVTICRSSDRLGREQREYYVSVIGAEWIEREDR